MQTHSLPRISLTPLTTHTDIHAHIHSLTHSYSLAHTHTHTLFNTSSTTQHSHANVHTHSLTLTHTLILTHTLTLARSFSLTHTDTLILTHSHSYTHIHTHIALTSGGSAVSAASVSIANRRSVFGEDTSRLGVVETTCVCAHGKRDQREPRGAQPPTPSTAVWRTLHGAVGAVEQQGGAQDPRHRGKPHPRAARRRCLSSLTEWRMMILDVGVFGALSICLRWDLYTAQSASYSGHVED